MNNDNRKMAGGAKPQGGESPTARYRTNNQWHPVPLEAGILLSPNKGGVFPIGFDGGYSAVNACCPSGFLQIPSLAVERAGDAVALGAPQPTDIEYRALDGNGRMRTWAVGEGAYRSHTKNRRSTEELDGEAWFTGPMYLVLLRAAIGICLIGGPGKDGFAPPADWRIAVATGLPPADVERSPDLRRRLAKVIAGRHTFELRIGDGGWEKFDFAINEGDVGVGKQAFAALFAAALQKDGSLMPGSERVFRDKTQVIDLGHGTADLVTIANNAIVSQETIRDSVMHEVMARTCDELKATYGERVTPAALHEALASGEIRLMTDRDRLIRSMVPIADIFQKHLDGVFEETFSWMRKASNDWEDVDIIIGEGGTYEAWKGKFEDRLSDLGVEFIPANVNIPEVSVVYANAYGYWQQLVRKLRKELGA